MYIDKNIKYLYTVSAMIQKRSKTQVWHSNAASTVADLAVGKNSRYHEDTKVLGKVFQRSLLQEWLGDSE